MTPRRLETAFVTGATGFIGMHVVEQLRARGVNVTAMHRAPAPVDRLRACGVSFAQASLEDIDSLARAIPEGCDAVFHLAANTSFWRGDRAVQHRDNVLGTRHVVDAAVARGVRCFVHTSSEAAFGEPSVVPFDETMPSNAEGSWIGYERTKWLAEQEARRGLAHGLETVIVNPAHVIGRYDTRSWARAFRLVRDGKLPGVPPGAGSWAWAEEVGKAHVAAALVGRSGENYLLGGVDASYVEAFGIISRLLGKKPPRPLPAWLLKLVARAQDLGSLVTRRAPDATPELAHVTCSVVTVRSDKAVAELGYQATPLEVMFRDCYEWLVTQGLI